MALDDLRVNSEGALSDLAMLDSNIKILESILQEIRSEMLKLDESVWNAKEKDKIDRTFIPYLKKFADSYPSYLQKKVEFARSAVKAHQELDKERSSLDGITGI